MIKDFQGNEIIEGDIVRSENLVTKETKLYLYSKINNTPYLLRYDDRGKVDEVGLLNIKIDIAVSLINDSVWKWIRIENKDEI